MKLLFRKLPAFSPLRNIILLVEEDKTGEKSISEKLKVILGTDILDSKIQQKIETEARKNPEKINKVLDSLSVGKDQVTRAKEILKSPPEKLLELVAADESLFHGKNTKENFQKSVAKNLKKALGGQVSEENLEGILDILPNELGTFYEKAKAEHVNFCDDEKSIDRDMKVFSITLDGKGKGRDTKKFLEFYRYEFKSVADYQNRLEAFYPELLDRIKGAKGNRKKMLSEKFKVFAQKMIDKNESIKFKGVESRLGRAERILSSTLDQAINPKSEMFIVSMKDVEASVNEQFSEENFFEKLPKGKFREIFGEKLKRLCEQKKQEIAVLRIKMGKAKIATDCTTHLYEKWCDPQDKNDRDFRKSLKKFKFFATPEGKWFDDDTFKALGKDLFAKMKTVHEEWVKKQESLDSKQSISREKMEGSYESFSKTLQKSPIEFKNFEAYKAYFIESNFRNESLKAQKYFKDHPNFFASFRTTFTEYQNSYESNVSLNILDQTKDVLTGISDEKIQAGILKSMQQEPSLEKKKEHLLYLKKVLPEYEKSLQNAKKISNQIEEKHKALGKNKAGEKVYEKFKVLEQKFQKNKVTYDERFISPRDFEPQLQSILTSFALVESGHEKDLEAAQKKIQNLNISSIGENQVVFKDFTSFIRGPYFQQEIHFSPEVWAAVKGDFFAKAKQMHKEYLYENFDPQNPERKETTEIKEAREIIQALDLSEISSEESSLLDYQKFSQHPKFKKALGFSDKTLKTVALQAHEKLSELHTVWSALHEKSPEKRLQIAEEALDSFSLKDFDLTDKKLVDKEHFREQFYELFYFDDQTWKKTQKKADENSDRLHESFLAYLEKNPEKRQKEAQEKIKNMSLGQIDLTTEAFSDFSEFAKNFPEINFDETTWKMVENDFWKKAKALHIQFLPQQKEALKLQNKKDQFLRLGKSYGLNFDKISDKNIEKIIQTEPFALIMDTLKNSLKNNPSFVSYLRNFEQDTVPFLVVLLGELQSDELKNMNSASQKPNAIDSQNSLSFFFQKVKPGYMNRIQGNFSQIFTNFQKRLISRGQKLEDILLPTEPETKDIDEVLEEELLEFSPDIEAEAIELEIPKESLESTAEEDLSDKKIESESLEEEVVLDEVFPSEQVDLDVESQLLGEDLEPEEEESSVAPETSEENREEAEDLDEASDVLLKTKEPQELEELEEEIEPELEAYEKGEEALSEKIVEKEEVPETIHKNISQQIFEQYFSEFMNLESILIRTQTYFNLLEENGIPSISWNGKTEILNQELSKKIIIQKPETLFAVLLDQIFSEKIKDIAQVSFIVSADVLELKIKKTFGISSKKINLASFL